MLPKYYFVKRQINKVKGWEANYSGDNVWGESLGFFKTMKEARIAVQKHKEKNHV